MYFYHFSVEKDLLWAGVDLTGDGGLCPLLKRGLTGLVLKVPV